MSEAYRPLGASRVTPMMPRGTLGARYTLRLRGPFDLSRFSFQPAGSDAPQHLGSRENAISPARPPDTRTRVVLSFWFATELNAASRGTPKSHSHALWLLAPAIGRFGTGICDSAGKRLKLGIELP
jgi:hypothetical protein